MHSLFRRRILKWWQKEFWSRKSSLAELKGMQAVVACTRKVGSCCDFFIGIDNHSMCVWIARSQHQLQLSLTLIFNHNRNFTSLTLRHYQRLSFWKCAFLSFPPHLSKSMQFLISIKNLDGNLSAEEFSAMLQNTSITFPFSYILRPEPKTFSS